MNTILVHKPYNPFSELVTVQSGYTEDGEFILEDCNHAGADYQAVTFEHLSYDPSYGNVQPTQTEQMVYQCNKCPMWSYDGKDWNE